ncbi:MAG: hypothetical protein U0805_20060 [Pirellulales bacterium]
MRGVSLSVCLLIASVGVAAPAGFVKTTIPLNGLPVGLAFDNGGTLYALEGASFGDNVATLRVIHTDGTFGGSFPVAGDDTSNFFVGSMAYDAVGNRLLVSDNTADGRLYAISKTGEQQTIAHDVAGIAGIAVRESGEIFVSTSPFGVPGEVLQVNRATGGTTSVLAGLGFGAGLAFDSLGNLIVQDSNTTTFQGRLQQLPMMSSGSGLTIGAAVPLLDGMQSAAGLVMTDDDAIFTTGAGGLFEVVGTPLAEKLFDTNGTASQFATAIAFDAGTQPFEPFAGPNGGRLAYMADFGFASQDSFITLLTPAEPGDYNADGHVDANDYSVWRAAFGTGNPAADGNRDGMVDAADYVLWRPHLVTQSVGSAGSSVPEPMLLTLVILPFLAIQLLGRFRQTRAAGKGLRSTPSTWPLARDKRRRS